MYVQCPEEANLLETKRGVVVARGPGRGELGLTVNVQGF